MYNRYQGNTGRVEKMREPDDSFPELRPRRKQVIDIPFSPAVEPEPPSAEPAIESAGERHSSENPAQSGNPHRPRREPEMKRRPPEILSGIQNSLGGILSKFNISELEMEDIIIMLVLFLLYRESEDYEFLIILGAMLVL